MTNLDMIIIYAFLNRFRGSSQKLMPKMAVCIIMALGYTMIVPWFTLSEVKFIPNELLAGLILYLGPICSIFVLVLTTMALQTGHGNFVDLGTWKLPSPPERLEFIIAGLKKKLSGYQYDFLGDMLTGVVVTLPLGIMRLDWRIALLGLMKGPCYALGRLVSRRYPVEMGEIFTGGIYGLTFAAAHIFPI